MPDAVGFERVRTNMLRLPADLGWEQVTAHYQMQRAKDWEAELSDAARSGITHQGLAAGRSALCGGTG